VLVIAIGVAVMVAGYQTQNLWLPALMAAIFEPRPSFPSRLNAIDHDGQLQIQWTATLPRCARRPRPCWRLTTVWSLGGSSWTARRLQAGTFVYSRQSERVDIKLAIHLPGGQQAHGATSFSGKAPDRKPPPEDPEIRKQRDALAEQAPNSSRTWRPR